MCEHGLSLYIEFQGKKLLFDTGQTGDFLVNADKLGKCVDAVDYVILSHGHYDHSGGVEKLLACLRKTTDREWDKVHREIEFYVGTEFFVPKYKRLPDGTYHFNGNPFSETVLHDISLQNNIGEDASQQRHPQLIKIEEDITYISENIIVFKNFERKNAYEQPNPRFYIKQGERYVPDSFADEIALGLVTSKGLVLVVGCSHVGIVNILQAVSERTGLPVYAVLGGTHLVEAGEARIQKTLEAFEAYGVRQLAVSHCTGEAGMVAIRSNFQGEFLNNNTGTVYRV